MRVLVLGGTRFLGRRVVERLHERGDEVLVAHRGRSLPRDWVDVQRIECDRRDLRAHAREVDAFGPEAVVDAFALTGADVDAVADVVAGLPAVVLSSQDVYQAHAGLTSGRSVAALPLTEQSELRTARHPYRGLDLPEVPDDYEKIDVEERWLAGGRATVLRLPMLYGAHDWQRREEPVLRRLRAGRARIPIGAANLLWSRLHVEDAATGVLAALGTRAAEGLAVNLAEPETVAVGQWLEQIAEAAGATVELARVDEDALPADLAFTGAPAQHLMVSVERARALLEWSPAPALQRVGESVRWHLEHPPEGVTWTDADAAADDAALV